MPAGFRMLGTTTRASRSEGMLQRWIGYFSIFTLCLSKNSISASSTTWLWARKLLLVCAV